MTDTLKRWWPALIFLLALCLRTGGLSHDLHLGWVYHPDTPKQMVAVEQFLDGHYFTITGNRDLDGYPYFTSHVIEYLVRGYDAIQSAVRAHIGLPPESYRPERVTLYWITRLLNAVVSSLAGVLVFCIGRRFWNWNAGAIASLWLALSPVDVTAAHYAAGDTMSAFWSLAAIYFALQVVHRNAARDYILGGIVAAAAFSSKYQGALTLAAFLIAHLVRYPPWRMTFTAPSIRRGLLLMVSFIAGVFVTSPALLIDTKRAFRYILQFLDHTSHYYVELLSGVERLQMGVTLNLPALADILGPIVVAAALVAMVVGYRRSRTWIIAVVPLLYLFVGLAMKPLTHAVYHTFVTPMIFLLAAAAMTRLFEGQGLRKTRIVVGLLLVLLSAGYLGAYSHREIFFFKRNDTRRVAETWALDNIPPSIYLDARAYTFPAHPWRDGGASPAHRAFAFARDMRDEVQRAFMLHDLVFETNKLSQFRNWPIRFFIHPSDLIRPGFEPAVWQILPATRQDNMIPLDAPWFHHSPNMLDVRRGDRLSLTLMSRLPLEKAVIVVRTDMMPARVKMWTGNRRHTLNLAPNQTHIIPVEHWRPARIARNPNRFYRWCITVPYGSARIHLATTPRDIAWAYFHEDMYEEAWAAFGDSENVADQTARQISGLVTGRIDPANVDESLVGPLSAEDFFRLFNVHPDYLSGLPGVRISSEQLTAFQPDRDEEGETDPDTAHVQTPGLLLEPGAYRFTVRYSKPQHDFRVQLLDGFQRVIEELDIDTTVEGKTGGSFVITRDRRRVRIRIVSGTGRLPDVEEVVVRPDALATLNALRERLRSPATTPVDESPHVLYSANARFAGGITLDSFVRGPDRIARGDLFPLNLYWDVSCLRDGLDHYAIWIHFLRADTDEIAFQGDYPLSPNRHQVMPHDYSAVRMKSNLPALVLEREPTSRPLWLNTVRIPDTVEPGEYRIKVGLWKPVQRRAVRLKEAGLPHDKRGVFIGSLVVK